MKQEKNIHSPYVVVLGGNTVRKKIASPSLHSDGEARVYGVVPSLKTMAQEMKVAESGQIIEKGKDKSYSFFLKIFAKKKKQETGMHEAVLPAQVDVPSLYPEAQNTDSQTLVHTTPIRKPESSVFSTKYFRNIAKKEYLKSKHTIQIPRHAKIGFGIAVLFLAIFIPVLSRFMAKPTTPSAGVIVAQGTQALVAQVSQSIVLPEGELPLVVVATADDIRRLNVKEAKPGNKILIYQKSGKIVVYDAESDKVLGVVNRSAP